MLKLRNLLFFAIVSTTITTGCAKRGTITGGIKDTIPPKIINSVPKNFITGFKGDFIKINFNEYIRVKDINKQLIISPPMKNAPVIVPLGNASKFITIKLLDTLQHNTTYSFNFGQSITDNNEGNPYSQFKYVISTGNYIDSLKLGGTIRDAYAKKPDNFVTIMLHEASEYNDSTVFKKPPHYVTNTLDSLKTYTLENLKPGKYQLIALKDKNGNFKFDPAEDKIGFLKNLVTIPNDSLYNLKLFKQQTSFKVHKPLQAGTNKLMMGFEGNPKNTKISVKKGDEIIDVRITKLSKKDTLQIWLPKIKTDSVKITVTNDKYFKTFDTRIKELKLSDTLSVEAKQKGVLNFRETFTLNTSLPLSKIENSKIFIIKTDSSKISFTPKYMEMDGEIALDFKKEEHEKYNIKLLPGALTDFYGKTNDTLVFTATTKNLSDYGNLKLTLENVNRFPVIIELLDSNENVTAAAYSEKENILTFEALEPSKYTLRVVYDDNKDGEWTTGNFIEKRPAEEVIYFPKELDIRANWDVDQVFILSK